MDDKRLQEDEYLLQYYKISVPAIMQCMYNALTFVVGNYTKSTAEEFSAAFDNKKDLCHSVFDNLCREYINNLVDIMNDREEELRDLLRIPPYVLLPEDDYHTKDYSDEKLQSLKKEIEDLENTYKKKKAYTFICEKELEILERLKPLNEMVNKIVSKLEGLKKRPCDAKLETALEKHNKYTDLITEKLFSDVAELKFGECD